MEKRERSEVRVAVLAGGISDEREISFASGENVMAALREAGYTSVELIDPASDGFFIRLSEGSFDAAFIALHGRGGEDGMIQSVLELLGIPYTGSNPETSALAVDKDVAKLLYARAGVPIAPSVAFGREDMMDDEDIMRAVGAEAFVKPVGNGSSYGVTHVKASAELPAALELAFEHGDRIMVESCVKGTEVTVGVLGDGEGLRALPVVEICVPQESDFYNLDVKYVDPTDIHRIPARLPQDVYERVQELAVSAHRALGCFGFSRSDFIVSKDGPVILETNTIPGMTPTSLFPDEAQHAGIPFSEVCAELIDLAFKRGCR